MTETQWEKHHPRRDQVNERRLAAANGGSITRQQQAALNRHENAISRQIGH